MPSSPATNSANTYNRKHVKQNVQIVRQVKRKKDKWGNQLHNYKSKLLY